MKAKKGFTLVEILIVVVILGILAAIVIPQFSEASTEARTNSLCSDNVHERPTLRPGKNTAVYFRSKLRKAKD